VPGLTLGFLSHVLAGLSPFIVAGVIARTGLLPGTALVYTCGALLLAATLLSRRIALPLLAETRAFAAPANRWLVLGSLAGFLAAGVSYYHGLVESARVAEYVFLTRLDWLVQAPVALLVLGEPWTRRALAGAAFALGGGLILTWTGAIGADGLLLAAAYIVASLVAYLCATPLTRARGVRGALALTYWRHLTNTAGFVVLAAGAGTLGARGINAIPAPGTLALAALSGLVLIGLFLSRFAALTRVPLWVLSAQAPVQALVAVGASLATEGRLPAPSALAIALIVSGEWLVTAQPPQTRP
jgi:drug/metabolite transporter (DMT)-like permease